MDFMDSMGLGMLAEQVDFLYYYFFPTCCHFLNWKCSMFHLNSQVRVPVI